MPSIYLMALTTVDFIHPVATVVVSVTANVVPHVHTIPAIVKTT